jgi:hypothetical protein
MAEQGNANRYGTLAVAQEKRFRMHAGSQVPTADVQTKDMEDVIKFCRASWGEKEKKLY